jgi:hypothetical protein
MAVKRQSRCVGEQTDVATKPTLAFGMHHPDHMEPDMSKTGRLCRLQKTANWATHPNYGFHRELY